MPEEFDVEEEYEAEAPARNSTRVSAPREADFEDEEEDPVADLLYDILDLMGFDADIEYEEREDHVRYHIEGPELGALIGRHGSTLEAMQFLVGVIIARKKLVDYKVVLDVEGYRDRRERQLRDLARRSAARAQREGRKVVLAPMPAGDRRVIHLALADHPRIRTYSEGEEPDRCVVVSPGSKDL